MNVSARQVTFLGAAAVLGCAASSSDPWLPAVGVGGMSQTTERSHDEGGATAASSRRSSDRDIDSGGSSDATERTARGGATTSRNSSGSTAASGSEPATSAAGGAQGSTAESTSRAAGGATVRASTAAAIGGRTASTKPLATGGRVATGGVPNAAGGAKTASSASPNSSSVSSPGCGAGKTTSPCSKSGTTCSLQVNGKTRKYYLQLPANYNASKPYPVVFQFHPLTGTAEMALNEYNISKGMPDAIDITPQGLKKFEQFLNTEATGWANTNGEDIQFTLDMLKAVQKDYCVDSTRVFSVGFSYGGMMSYAIGCELGGTFRAIAPMSGATISGCTLSGKPVAMWGSHGKSDSVVALTQGQQARDKILKQNHCGTQTKPVDPSPCVEYQGCDAGYPVVWCEWDGNHATPSFSASAIASFFKQF